MAEIKVICIQANQRPDGPGRLKTYEAGKEYIIDESEFAPNLFVEAVKPKLKTKNETTAQEGKES